MAETALQEKYVQLTTDLIDAITENEPVSKVYPLMVKNIRFLYEATVDDSISTEFKAFLSSDMKNLAIAMYILKMCKKEE